MSCAHHVFEDYALSPVDLGVGRLETEVCGHYGVGDNACWVNDTKKISDVQIDVNTYFDGTLFVLSKACGIEAKVNYPSGGTYSFQLSQFTKAPLTGLCMVDILMTPNFPGSAEAGVATRSFSGRVILASRGANDLIDIESHDEDFEGEGYDDRLTYPGVSIHSFDGKDLFNILNGVALDPGEGEGVFVLGGCAGDPLELPYSGEILAVPFIKLMDEIPEIRHCAVYGRQVPADGTRQKSMILSIELRKPGYQQLAEPLVTIKDELLSFKSNEPISWSLLSDGQAVNGASGEFKIDPKKVYRLVQITAGGRSKVLRIAKGKVIWSE